MKFDDFDKEMRIYEESIDQYILPDMYIVARLDGRSFTRLTKEICKFEAPFDIKFKDLMVETVKTLLNVGFRIVFGYTESDEISLLFHPKDRTFGRKVRKINTTLAGEATAHAGAYAMADAWGIGDNQRWAWVGFRLGDSLDGLVVVGSHGNLSHVNIAVGDGHSG